MKTSKTNARVVLYALAISIVISSCTKEMCNDPNNLGVIGVERHLNTEADIPGINNAEKAYIHNFKVYWASTDQLNVNGYFLNIDPASIDNTNDNPRAQFSGITYTPSGNNYYWAVYPIDLAAASSGGTVNGAYRASTLTYTMPATQTFDIAADTMSGNTYMAGYATSSNPSSVVFSMKNLGAVLHLKLQTVSGSSNTHVEKIVFTTTNGALCGTFSVNNNYNITAQTAERTLTVNLKNGSTPYIDISTAKDIYVMLPPIASGTQLTMRIYTVDGYYVEKSSGSRGCSAMDRSTIYHDRFLNISYPEFSVSSTKKVIFAPGNLRYQATTSTWQFARLQYLYIGNASGNNTAINSRSDQSDTIDLFAWGTSGWKSEAMPYQLVNYYPDNSASNDLTGTYAEADWGWHNSIYNPKTGKTDPENTWRTPTYAEWDYLIATRSGNRFAKATVVGKEGLIILPDNWSSSTYSLSDYNGGGYSSNTINASDWTILENAGCVFLPAAGHNYPNGGNSVKCDHQAVSGFYWSSTSNNINTPYSKQLYFTDSKAEASATGARNNGQAVRLVKDLN